MALEEKLAKIEILAEEWKSLQPLKKEDEDRLWKKFRLEWNYNSNHIEGNTLTYGETMLLLVFGKTTGDHTLREYQEMKSHDLAIELVRDWANEAARNLSESDIRSLNKLILVEPFWKEAMTYDGQSTRRLIKTGEYKEHPNSVRLANGEMFHYLSPEETPLKMMELMNWLRESKALLHPLILASELHYRFVRIHPFDDGNGRVARLIMNFVLMQNGLPPVIIKTGEKSRYFTALQKADSGMNEAFSEYTAELLLSSLELSISAANGGLIE